MNRPVSTSKLFSWFIRMLLLLLLISTPFLLFLLFQHIKQLHGRPPAFHENISSGYSHNNSRHPSPTPTFEHFSMDIFRSEVTSDALSLHYFVSNPKEYGIEEIPVTLTAFSKKSNSGQQDTSDAPASLSSLYARLKTYPSSALSKEEQLTYSALERALSLSIKQDAFPYLKEVLGPTTGFQAQLPILLAEYHFDRKEDIELYLHLLPCVYDCFCELAAYEKQKSTAGYFMTDSCAKKIIEQCLSFAEKPEDNFLIKTFEERLCSLPLSIEERTGYILRNRTAIYTYVLPAYELLAKALTDCLGTGKNPYGLCRYEGGREYYEAMIQSRTGSDKTLKELESLLLSAIREHTSLLASSIAENANIYDEYTSFQYPETSPENILSYLLSACSSDFPSFQLTHYAIKPVPASLQKYVSPAMYLIPPIDDSSRNTIYINPNPAYDETELFPTIAHEGFPGHMYQSISALSASLHPLRYLLAPTGYVEGWATYAELYSYRYAGVSDTLTTFLRSNQVISLCLYSLSDLLIHACGYTPAELESYLKEYGILSSMSDCLYETLLAEPGAYLPYAIGYLELADIQQLAKTKWGDGYSDLRFHSFLMELGPVPFSVLRQELCDS